MLHDRSTFIDLNLRILIYYPLWDEYNNAGKILFGYENCYDGFLHFTNFIRKV